MDINHLISNQMQADYWNKKLHSNYRIKHKLFLDTIKKYPQAMTVIIASLIGDADLCPVPRGYAVFRDHHGADQYEWLKFKSRFLPPHPFFRITSFGDGSYSLTSQSNPLFSELERHFYRAQSNKNKITSQRKKREKYPDQVALQMCEEIFSKEPWLAMAILIGDDGSLISSITRNTVTFEYVIYSQGFAREIGLQLKEIIERATGLQLSFTKASAESGIRLTISGITQIKLISKMISPYLSQVKLNIFQRKYDLNRHVRELSKKHQRTLSIACPVNYWTEQEIEILKNGISKKLKPVEVHRRLLDAGFMRTYYATYYKYKCISEL
ncbi:hypothetical protein [Desulfoscipio geothermicus]|uniref:LAGLIDADG DNA endonuclease family protein n=1 Tax=Desulfoscipio geothermicus DSM 3669 TaxID=1121426 RepID=A0A1I6CUK1_9FIRM|nr:hypothetical protein [Desulfoscipio geothermicus]SFQ96879.1 hypothetical protein SAMN05660706_10276 [Desulfoscipio geothermicus DSM 3669]